MSAMPSTTSYAHDMTARETAAVLHEKMNAVNDAARRIRKKALRIYQRLLKLSSDALRTVSLTR